MENDISISVVVKDGAWNTKKPFDIVDCKFEKLDSSIPDNSEIPLSFNIYP